MSKPFDLSVHLVIDPSHTPDGQFATVLETACQNGVTIAQLRCKDLDTKPFLKYAQTAKSICKKHNIPFIINDRIDIALAVDADGVHIGQDDMPAQTARQLLGDNKIIGLTIRTTDEAHACPVSLLDYASIGAVFATGSKNVTTDYVGLDGLRNLSQIIKNQNRPLGPIPLCAISGINAHNAGSVIDAGVDGVSVITHITQAPCVATATKQLRHVVDTANAKK